MTRWVYAFGDGHAEGTAAIADLLGGKGANLAEMSRLGLPVPPGFTITTQACARYYAHQHVHADDLKHHVTTALHQLERLAGAAFGDPENPLLISVRSGAHTSMPGMMDTVLNLGLNAVTARGLAERSGDARFAYDTYRRFIQMYASVVLGLDHGLFEEILESEKADRGIELDTDLDADGLAHIADLFLAQVERARGAPFPDKVDDQLWGAIGAVFASWQSPRAIAYRQIHGLADDGGTAVTVQAMVFGNRGLTSATGVAFTRDPATGEKALHGEYLINAQGEDVVAGLRTPRPLTRLMRERQSGRALSLEETMPDAFAQLDAAAARLERHFRDVQDVEFTVQEGRLFLLQTRTAKRNAHAAVTIAVAMVAEGLITRAEAMDRVDAAALAQLAQPVLDAAAAGAPIASGLGASPGAAAGQIALTAEEAEGLAAQGLDAILVRTETSPQDIRGMHAAKGTLTVRGGLTSHAAVVARGLGRPCVCGAGQLKIDSSRGELHCGDVVLRRGDVITIDGGSGHVFRGAAALRQPDPQGDFATLMRWIAEKGT